MMGNNKRASVLKDLKGTLSPIMMVKDTINKAYFCDRPRLLRTALWVGYFIYFKFICFSSIVYQSLHL